MSNFARFERRPVQVPGSPSLDSDVLSASALPSVASTNQSGWVLFSPPPSERGAAASTNEAIEPLSLTNAARQAPETILAADLSRLELPTHNGAGSFHEPASVDLFERVNTWRQQTEGEPPRRAMWSWLARQAQRSLRLIEWDEQTIDALFSPNFSRDAQPANPRDAMNAESIKYAAQSHFERARQYGPRGWEERMLRRGRKDDGLLVTLLATLFEWSKPVERAERRVPPSRPIASVTSSFAAWSDTWETTSY